VTTPASSTRHASANSSPASAAAQPAIPRSPRGLLALTRGESRTGSAEGRPAGRPAGLTRQSENGYAELKTRLRGAAFILRSRSPELACQEMFAFLTACQALCALEAGPGPAAVAAGGPRPGQNRRGPGRRSRPGLGLPRRHRRPAGAAGAGRAGRVRPGGVPAGQPTGRGHAAGAEGDACRPERGPGAGLGTGWGHGTGADGGLVTVDPLDLVEVSTVRDAQAVLGQLIMRHAW
jgi:hypothetical protein